MSFESFEKIDAHLHFNVENAAVEGLAEKYGFVLVTVNVEFPEFGPIENQEAMAKNLRAHNASRIHYITTFSVDNWESPGWLTRTIERIEQEMVQGAVGVKIWKNIGMSLRDSDGKMVFIDDDRLDDLFDFFERRDIPVMMHQGEPKNCWLPLEEMTMKYDRDYFAHHPQYHFYRHPDLPSYRQLLEARDRRLLKNPNLKSIQAHLGSMEWDVDLIAAFLDRFPNALVDTAARMNHLMYQTRQNWQRVRDFFLRYQDRILYGTDFFVTSGNKETADKELERLWLSDWEFLSTDNRLLCDEFEGAFYGLKLPETVLEKVFSGNAQRAFNLHLPVRTEFVDA